jgi:hypothetical protein
MAKLIHFALTLGLAFPHAGAARLGEVICDDRARLENQLSHIVGATRQSRGLRGPDALIEVWIEPRSGNWTMVQSYANGTSCIIAVGEHWELLKDPDPA